MAALTCYDVTCVTDGVQVVWAATEPTECPIDGGHTVDAVARTHDGVEFVERARETFYIHDGAGRVFTLTTDQDGVLSTSQISGPAPA